MSARVAYLLGLASLENACALYFLVAPIFLDRLDSSLATVLFGAGHAISGFIVFLALIEKLTRFSDRVAFRWSAAPFLLMAGVVIFSVAVNAPENFLQPWWHYHKYLKVLLPLACLFVMANIWGLRDIPKLYALLTVFTMVSIGFMFLEILMSPGGLIRPGREMILFDDANKFAVVLNVFYGLALPKLLDAVQRGKPYAFPLSACLVVFVALSLTQSRSGIFTCLVLSLACVLATRSKRMVRIAAMAFIPVLALFMAAFALRYSSTAVTAESDAARLLTYGVGYNIVRDRLLLGVGFAGVIEAYEQYGGVFGLLLKRPMAIHNTMLEALAEMGIPGLVAYLLMTFVPVFVLIRRIRSVKHRYPVVEVAALTVPVVFFCYGLFYPSYFADDHFWIYMVIPLIVIRSRVPDDFELKLPRPRFL